MSPWGELTRRLAGQLADSAKLNDPSGRYRHNRLFQRYPELAQLPSMTKLAQCMIKLAQLASMIEIVFKREVYRIRVSRALELIQRLPQSHLKEI